MPQNNKVKPIAIYLPQFHPIPENDEWWGKGFTEWTNVTKAKPLFNGHYQPHLPTDLGFYDLRLSEAREEQAKLAAEYGIYGFCYYHYWFNGRRILERPFQEVFETGKPDFPFMLCWANENWTRTWDGGENKILLKQEYNEDDDRNHIKYLIPYFQDSRYIKIDGKPIFAIYRSTLLPNAERTIQIWREEAAKFGLELYICRFDTFKNEYNFEETKLYDALIDFQPFGKSMEAFNLYKHAELKRNKIKWFIDKLYREYLHFTMPQKYAQYLTLRGGIKNYEEYVNFYIKYDFPKANYFWGLTPSWDNSSRKKQGIVILDKANPETFKKWLLFIVSKYKNKKNSENLVFINAWNEWAEGNHLEPCRRWGRKYLEVIKEVIDEPAR